MSRNSKQALVAVISTLLALALLALITAVVEETQRPETVEHRYEADKVEQTP